MRKQKFRTHNILQQVPDNVRPKSTKSSFLCGGTEKKSRECIKSTALKIITKFKNTDTRTYRLRCRKNRRTDRLRLADSLCALEG